MRFEPREYQVQMIDFACERPRLNLYADMGLGKTAAVLEVIRRLELDDVLIVAPKMVAKNTWVDEIHKWDDFHELEPDLLLGDDKGVARRALIAPGRISIVNYDNLIWLLRQITVDGWPWKTVVCDESTRLKGFRIKQGTKRSNVLAQRAHWGVERWINLSGTPAPNGVIDLWGPQWFVDGGDALGRFYSAYTQRWFYREATDRRGTGPLKPFPGAQAEIESRIRDTTMSVRTKDWFDIADPIIVPRSIELPPEVWVEYKHMQRQLFAEVERGVVTAANAAVKSLKLLQIANGAIYHSDKQWSWVHDAKVDMLESIAEEAVGSPLLVVYQFQSDLQRLKHRFKEAVEIHELNAIERWNKGKIPMLLAHPKSAGHGLNLQHGGHRIVYFGETWDLELYAQVLERIGPVRQFQSGYDRPVYVYQIHARGTIDEAVSQRIESKAEVLETLMDAMRSDHG